MTSQVKFRHVLVALMAFIVSSAAFSDAEAQLQSHRSRTVPTVHREPARFGFASDRTVNQSRLGGQQAGARQVVHREIIRQDEPPMVMEESIIGSDSIVGVTSGCASCGTEVVCGADWTGYCDSCNTCGVDQCGGCNSCGVNGCMIPCPQISIRNMEFFGGAQGFKGQPNRGREGSFGFNAGFNWGFDLPCMTNNFLSGQFGIQTIQSNFEDSYLTSEKRSQTFATVGLFRRVDYGLQGGVVADILNDNWYADMSIAQLRGKMSWMYQGGNELGFAFATSIQNDTNPVVFANNPPANGVDTWQALDTYRFFYTHQLNCYCPGAFTTLNLGSTGNSDFTFGSDFWLPVADRWALSTGFMYLIPDDNAGINGAENEAWNVGLNLTFYPNGVRRYLSRYNRPMFNVADNATFLIDR